MLISGLMRTLNEAENLKESLLNWLHFCDEIVLSDGGSTDDTRRVAEDICGDKLVWVDYDGGTISDKVYFNHAGRQLNAGLAACSGDWVITQDVDVLFCDKFCYEIRGILAEAKYDAYCMFGVHVWDDWNHYADEWLEGPGLAQVFRRLPEFGFPDEPEHCHYIEVSDREVGVLNMGLFHWGYMDPETEVEKARRRAMALDGDNTVGWRDDTYIEIAQIGRRNPRVRPIPWHTCHASCEHCWMVRQSLENRGFMWDEN